jgi:hypothetical protein
MGKKSHKKSVKA